MRIHHFLLAFFLLLGCQAQTHRFASEIQAFDAADRQAAPPPNGIVFTGSSSIRLWENLPVYFPGLPLIQRGFGGSELSDVRHFVDQLIIRYQPRQVVLYAGENDIATGKVSGRETYARFVDLFRYVRKRLPATRITFIAIKPSPSRRQFKPAVDEANRLIERYLARKKNTDFVDIRPGMLGPGGAPRPELFRADSLHMTPKGYAIWGKVLGPYLK